MTRVLVTGANGFVGSALIARLARDDRFSPVAAMRRADAAPAGAECIIVGDLAQLAPSLAGIDVIVHCAARVHVMREEAADPLKAFRRDNVETTLQLAQDAARAGVKRFVFLSSVKAAGEQSFGAPLTESMPAQPETPYGQSKLEAETALMQLARATGLGVTILRPPLVYAGHAKGNFRLLLNVLSRGMPLPLASVQNKRSMIALDNLVDVCVTALSHPAAINDTFYVCDGEDVSTPDMLRAIASGMGKQALLLPFPISVLKAAAGMVGKSDSARQLCCSLAIDSSKVRQRLGWQPPTSAREGLRDAGAAFAQRKTN